MQSLPVVDDHLQRQAPVALPSTIMTDRSRPQCGIGYVSRRLAGDYPNTAVPKLITRIRGLIRSWGFPPPVTLRLYRGEWLSGVEGVCRSARWDKHMVDEWFDDRLPPQVVLAIDNDELEHAGDVMDANAAAIGARR